MPLQPLLCLLATVASLRLDALFALHFVAKYKKCISSDNCKDTEPHTRSYEQLNKSIFEWLTG